MFSYKTVPVYFSDHGSKPGEIAADMLISSPDIGISSDHGISPGSQGGQYESGSSPQLTGCHRTAPESFRASDPRILSGYAYSGSHFIQFASQPETVLEYIFPYMAFSRYRREYSHYRRLQICGKSRIRFCLQKRDRKPYISAVRY